MKTKEELIEIMAEAMSAKRVKMYPAAEILPSAEHYKSDMADALEALCRALPDVQDNKGRNLLCDAPYYYTDSTYFYNQLKEMAKN